jgi:hypothetical protein
MGSDTLDHQKRSPKRGARPHIMKRDWKEIRTEVFVEQLLWYLVKDKTLIRFRYRIHTSGKNIEISVLYKGLEVDETKSQQVIVVVTASNLCSDRRQW